MANRERKAHQVPPRLVVRVSPDPDGGGFVARDVESGESAPGATHGEALDNLLRAVVSVVVDGAGS